MTEEERLQDQKAYAQLLESTARTMQECIPTEENEELAAVLVAGVVTDPSSKKLKVLRSPAMAGGHPALLGAVLCELLKRYLPLVEPHTHAAIAAVVAENTPNQEPTPARVLH